MATSPITKADYDAIEAAVMETARGRWFLGEFARRRRSADTTVLLDAIERLEQALAGERGLKDPDRLRLDFLGIAEAVGLARAEVGALPGEYPEAGRAVQRLEELEARIEATIEAWSGTPVGSFEAEGHAGSALHVEAFAAVDALGMREKLERFT